MYKYATIDIETTGLNRYKDSITWIGVGLAEDIHSYAKIKTFDMSTPEGQKGFFAAAEKIRLDRIKTVFQNGKFDTLFILEKYGIKIPISHDVMLMGTAFDLAAEHGLKRMAQKYLCVPDWDISKKDKTDGTSAAIRPYLRKDVKYTWELFKWFTAALNGQQRKLYTHLLRPAYRLYVDIENNGFWLDMDALHTAKEKYAQLERERLDALNAQYQINWNSSAQVAGILFDREKMPILKKSEKTGKPSADASVLKHLAAKGYELPQMILDYKAVNTLNKMFLNRWENDIAPDGRIHPTFNLTNVVSGRTSSNNPNLQQCPNTPDVRSIFRAPPGRCFFEADYSQLELRIAAHYANDQTMIDIYNNNGDIHTETAKLLTGGREPTKVDRKRAKPANFGLLYGMGAKKFVIYAFDSYGVTFTLREAQDIRAKFFRKYSALLPWHEKQRELCEAQGGVYNLFGRFRKLPNIYSEDKWERAGAERRAINTPVQGTGSDILLCAVTQIAKELKGTSLKIVGTVHDSILGEFDESEKDFIPAEIRRIMCHPKALDDFGIKLRVPLDCDIGVGPWGTH